jgi:oligopeptide transport system substrate-binding protein
MRRALFVLPLLLLAGGVRAQEAPKDYDFDAIFPAGDGWKKSEQVFRWNNDAEPETLDPAKMTGVPEHNLALGLYEGLASQHPETLAPIPGVAERWEIDKDGVVYTFHLRKNAKWSNGEPFTAEDIRWSWERALTPATECKYTEMFNPIRGAEAFYLALVEGKPASWKDVGVEVVDPHTLRVTLGAPTAYFLELCAFETLMPVHRASIEKHGEKWTQPGNLVGNGPFVLDVWKPRDRIEMVPNPHWWNRRIVRLERTIVDATDDLSTSFNKYLAGDVDWIRQVTAAKVEEAQAHPDYYVSPYLGSYFFRFNCTKKPFDDVRVRKAFTQSIDKKAICDNVLKAGQTPASGVVALGIPGYPELKGLEYDPKRARELLAEAGYPEGKGFPDVAVLYNTHESHKQVCEQMVEMWKTTLGVKVRLDNREWKVYLEDTRKLQYDVVRGAWIGDYADPSTFLDMWCTGRGNNNTGWSSAKYDELLARSVRETDPVKRFAILQEAERIVCVDELPILPVYYYVNQGMLRPRVKGWFENVRDLHPLQYVFIDGPPARGK